MLKVAESQMTDEELFGEILRELRSQPFGRYFCLGWLKSLRHDPLYVPQVESEQRTDAQSHLRLVGHE